MPVVKRFDGYVIRMYIHDHNPPHVHVVGRDFKARVGVFRGGLRSRIACEALTWIKPLAGSICAPAVIHLAHAEDRLHRANKQS